MLTLSTSSFVLVSAAWTTLVASTPSTKQLGDIAVLSSDNLRTSDAAKTSAALLLRTYQTESSAASSCAALSESLWSPSKQNFDAGLNSSIAYEVYAGHYSENQLFWVASEAPQWPRSWRPHHWKKPQQCTAIDVHGTCHSVPCQSHLPALCTQSAPTSNPTFQNTSAPYQIAQVVGQQTLVGYRDFYSFRFLGIRFAEEPERFAYSTPFTTATGTNSALTPAPECLQAPNNGSTDCLFLNLWTTTLPGAEQPAKADLKPVMVYIYGGGFATGSATSGTTDGGNQASRGDVVVVDIAYRLNSLGFLVLPDGVHNGNYFLSDQISALEWVRDNIAYFGGDPEKITILGESAGAESVQALLATPKAIGLFRGAIMQSNYFQPYTPLEKAYNQSTVPILEETGCANSTDQLACLQAYNATALINLKTNFNYPVIDGTYLLTDYINLNASAAGKVSSSVPVMTGVNRDEAGVLISNPDTTNLTAAILETQPPAIAQAILSNLADFPLGTGPYLNDTPINHVFNTTIRIATDQQFHCADEYTALAAVKSGIWPTVYYFEWNRTYQDPAYNGNNVCQAPVTPTHPNGDPQQEYFKCHAGDLANSFGNVVRVGFPERDEYDVPFGQLSVDYWTSFGRTLDPNPDPGFLKARGYWNTLNQNAFSGPWEPVNLTNPSMMELQWNSAMRPFPDAAQCAVLGMALDTLTKNEE